MFEQFALDTVTVGGQQFRMRTGGTGAAVLLLHGHPQTHVMWHRVAPSLAEHSILVMPDLPGYGSSSGRPSTPDSSAHSKRAMADDLIALMRDLGHDRFAVVGHDRGGRIRGGSRDQTLCLSESAQTVALQWFASRSSTSLSRRSSSPVRWWNRCGVQDVLLTNREYGVFVSERVGVGLVAATLVTMVIAGCGGQALGVQQRDADVRRAGPTGGDLLAGVPDDCRLVEAMGAPNTPNVDDEALGRLVASGIDVDADRGPLVAVEAGDDAGLTVVAATLFDDRGHQSGDAVWVVEHGQHPSVTAANRTAAAISTAQRVAVDTAGEDPVAHAMASVQDCSAAAAAELRPEPAEPPPSRRPDLLVVDPARVAPGETVALRFPKETERGVAFQLDRRDGDLWSTRYWLTSDGNGGQPVSVPVGTEGYGVEDVGVAGAGPDHVSIPDDAAPGAYRICTANAGDEFCAAIKIIDDKQR